MEALLIWTSDANTITIDWQIAGLFPFNQIFKRLKSQFLSPETHWSQKIVLRTRKKYAGIYITRYKSAKNSNLNCFCEDNVQALVFFSYLQGTREVERAQD